MRRTRPYHRVDDSFVFSRLQRAPRLDRLQLKRRQGTSWMPTSYSLPPAVVLPPLLLKVRRAPAWRLHAGGLTPASMEIEWVCDLNKYLRVMSGRASRPARGWMIVS
eukprot:scaffold576699_cov20-Prasinocladus_malaysianus.AAC.1